MALRTALITSTALAFALSATAADKRELGAHEHGVGALNIAVEGATILMELEAPGADIVGFEHPAESAEDKGKIKAALEVLEKPLQLITLPTAAGCAVTEAHAKLVETTTTIIMTTGTTMSITTTMLKATRITMTMLGMTMITLAKRQAIPSSTRSTSSLVQTRPPLPRSASPISRCSPIRGSSRSK